MEIERPSSGYIRGYTRAIQDIIEIFTYVHEDMKEYKKHFNIQRIMRLLNLILEYRDNFRENFSGFIRWNNNKQDFEFYDPNKKE